MTFSPLPPRVDGYGLDAPTHASAVAALARHVGAPEAERLWTAACAAAGVVRRGAGAPDDLQRVAAHLAKERSIVGVCANSIHVRIISYTMLLRKQQAQLQSAGVPAGR